MSIEKMITTYFLVINLLTFITFGIDKLKAKAHWWRIPENILLTISLLGGFSGGWFAMLLFRHKTKDSSFLHYMIFITLIWLIGIIVFLIKLKSI